MPQEIKALIVIVLIGLLGFYLAKKIALSDIPASNFNTLRNVWLAVILTAFLAHNYWLFLLISSILILVITKNEKNKIAVFFILVFSIPTIGAQISGLGLLNYLFFLSYPMFISLVVLLPAALALAKKNNFKFTSIWSDKFLLLYILLSLVLSLRNTTFTDMLRGALYVFFGTFLPYYVTSRGIKNLSEMNKALHAFVTIAIITSLIAVFEFSRYWVLFSSLGDALGTGNDMTGYLARQGNLRAVASLVHALVLGAFLSIGFCYYLYTSSRIKNPKIKNLAGLIILLGLFATLSRGPWAGAFLAIIIYTMLGQKPLKKLGSICIYVTIIFTILSLSPRGEKYLNILPLIGKISVDSNEQFNINYREKLLENAFIVINRYPFFGSTNYLETPEMQEMIQGEGIIDIVNSYVGIALEHGYVGLVLFLGVFISVISTALKNMKLAKNNVHLHSLGASLISAIIGFMIIITAASFVGAMQVICWSVVGMGVAYTKVVNEYLKQEINNNIA
jgi:O-antigen ligase